MPGFNLDDYEPVADRIERFWEDHPEGRILTSLVYRDEQRFVVKCFVWRSPSIHPIEVPDPPGQDESFVLVPADRSAPDATGYAEEVIGSTNVNRTSALENCETSAIGRALANLGYAVKNRASREEMAKAQPEPRPRSGGRRTVPTPEAPQNHQEAPTLNDAEIVATYAKSQTTVFLRWSDGERADSYKRHSKNELGGKPSSLEEVDRVVKAMREEYLNLYPEGPAS